MIGSGLHRLYQPVREVFFPLPLLSFLTTVPASLRRIRRSIRRRP